MPPIVMAAIAAAAVGMLMRRSTPPARRSRTTHRATYSSARPTVPTSTTRVTTWYTARLGNSTGHQCGGNRCHSGRDKNTSSQDEATNQASTRVNIQRSPRASRCCG